MKSHEQYQDLINCLKTALGMLDLDTNSQLRQDVTAISDYLANPCFRIAVFAPFNHGKSTLLNAI